MVFQCFYRSVISLLLIFCVCKEPWHVRVKTLSLFPQTQFPLTIKPQYHYFIFLRFVNPKSYSTINVGRDPRSAVMDDAADSCEHALLNLSRLRQTDSQFHAFPYFTSDIQSNIWKQLPTHKPIFHRDRDGICWHPEDSRKKTHISSWSDVSLSYLSSTPTRGPGV